MCLLNGTSSWFALPLLPLAFCGLLTIYLILPSLCLPVSVPIFLFILPVPRSAPHLLLPPTVPPTLAGSKACSKGIPHLPLEAAANSPGSQNSPGRLPHQQLLSSAPRRHIPPESPLPSHTELPGSASRSAR